MIPSPVDIIILSIFFFFVCSHGLTLQRPRLEWGDWRIWEITKGVRPRSRSICVTEPFRGTPVHSFYRRGPNLRTTGSPGCPLPHLVETQSCAHRAYFDICRAPRRRAERNIAAEYEQVHHSSSLLSNLERSFTIPSEMRLKTTCLHAV